MNKRTKGSRLKMTVIAVMASAVSLSAIETASGQFALPNIFGGPAAQPAPAPATPPPAATVEKTPVPVPNPHRKGTTATATASAAAAPASTPPPSTTTAPPTVAAQRPPSAATTTAALATNAVPPAGPPAQLAPPPVRYTPNMFVPQAQFKPAEVATLQKISALFNSIRTMQGSFIQVGPHGEQAEGKFQLARPGRIRFQYDPPAKLNVVSDGTSVSVEDGNARTQNIYPLAKTPLKHLLADKIDLSSPQIVAQMRDLQDMIALTISEQSFNDGVLTLFFDKTTFDLRQWVVTDSQGLDTSVAIYNVANDKPVSDTNFKIAAQ